MTTFQVTPSDLEALAGRLSALLGELADASSGLNGAAGSAQNGKLEGSIESFLGDWSNGLDGLRKELGEIADRLQGAGDAYDNTEGMVGAGFGS
jgi:hypothetical protein